MKKKEVKIMELIKEKYIILEIIPTALTPERGEIIQLSALKIDGLKLLDRFDYRLNEKYIFIEDFKNLISYDKDLFVYKDSTKAILKDFEKWSENLPLLIMDNKYTKNFLQSLNNPKESISNYLNKEYTDKFIDELIEENKIEPTNYIVDILYESLIKHL